MDVKLVFRIKEFDEKRGFPRYFWKAVPIASSEAKTQKGQAAE